MLVALYRSRSPLASVDLSFAICVTEALRPATTVGAWPENGYLRLVIESLDDDRRAFRVAQRHGRATRRRQGCGGGVGRRDVEVAAGGRGLAGSCRALQSRRCRRGERLFQRAEWRKRFRRSVGRRADPGGPAPTRPAPKHAVAHPRVPDPHLVAPFDFGSSGFSVGGRVV